MRLFFSILCLLLSFLSSRAIVLSDSANISLLTCGPGKELYAKFGHTAIRVSDPVNHLDICFNYGYFDYNAPGFYYKFINGETDYQLGICPTMDFMIEYRLRQINMWEQELNLKPLEKQLLFDALITNFEPQNRYYRYNFVFDNCATRPRDMILKAIGGKVIFDQKLERQQATFQQLIDLYTADNPAELFGIHLILGAPKDAKATFMQMMFLPERLRDCFQTAVIQRDSLRVPMVKRYSHPIAISGQEIKPTFNYVILLVLFIFIVVLWMNFRDRRKGAITFWLDSILFGLAGLAGCIIFYLTSFSVHPLVSFNWNVVWLNPLLLIFALLVLIRPARKLAFCLQYLFLGCEIFMLGGLFFLPQSFVLAEIILMLTLALRSVMYVVYKKDNFKESITKRVSKNK